MSSWRDHSDAFPADHLLARSLELLVQSHGDLFEQVQICYEKHGWKVPEEPTEFPIEQFRFRVGCMMEELSEYTLAATHADRLDALVDLSVFTIGTALMHGYNHQTFYNAFQRVMIANTKKEAGPTPKRGSYSGDLIKPPGWEAPDLRDLVGESLPLTQRDLYDAQDAASARDVHKGYGLASAIKADLTVKAKTSHHEIRDAARIKELEDELDSIPQVFRDAAKLCNEKSKDYGDRDLSRRDYHPFGHVSYQQMVHTKFLRIKSVSQQDAIHFESLRDSLVDMINYLGFYSAWLDEEGITKNRTDSATDQEEPKP